MEAIQAADRDRALSLAVDACKGGDRQPLELRLNHGGDPGKQILGSGVEETRWPGMKAPRRTGHARRGLQPHDRNSVLAIRAVLAVHYDSEAIRVEVAAAIDVVVSLEAIDEVVAEICLNVV